MNPERWAHIQELFDAALARDPADRAAFLDEACRGDTQLREEVASLIAAHDGSGPLLDRPVFEVAAGLLADDIPMPLDGRTVGPYIVRQEIGRGGMGIVYLADDTRLSRRVALKAVSPSLRRDAGRRERLRQEARAAAALSHPGIATVFAIEEIDGELYLACEYVSGPTLRALLQSGPIPATQAVDIALQLARALAAAHAQGVVHRDLKPENIVRTAAGVVKILDFGIARLDGLTPSSGVVHEGAIGTPGYMAPEQARGEPVDFRADLFSLGVLTREITSGQPVPSSLANALSLCLRENPAERYASTTELVHELERVQTEMQAVRRPRVETSDADRSTARWWWEFHQAAVSATHVLMMYPAWRVRTWLPSPWGTAFLLVALACAAAGTSLRLHLWFTSRFHPAGLDAERARSLRPIGICDAGLVAALLIAALVIGDRHAAVAMLLVTVGVATAVASLAIEPATARAAFARDP